MRLIRCHIENFGKWSSTDFKFRKGLNGLLKENGGGKSTLAAFIRVMLFGFENETKSTQKRERELYRPWQNGVYGGWLEFETGGKTYILSRTFGTREKEDTFSLRESDTNLESSDFSANIGEELFKLDRDSFSRTVFISQNDCETEVSDRINAKIGNLAENTDDINNYENVDKKLADLLNKMSPSRATGTINKMDRQIAQLREQIRAGGEIGRTIDDITERVRRQKKEQEELRQEQQVLFAHQQKISRGKDVQAKRETYGNLCQEFEERQETLRQVREAFPGQVPVGQNLEHFIAESAKLPAAKDKADYYRMKEDEQEIYEKYLRQFQQGIPEDAWLDETAAGWNARTEKRNMLNINRELLGDLERKADEMAETEQSREAGERKKSSVKKGLVLTAGVLLILLAVFVVMPIHQIAAVCLAAGAVVMVVVMFLVLNKSMENRIQSEKQAVKEAWESNGGPRKIQVLKQQISEDEAYAGMVEKEIQNLFSSMGISYDENKVPDTLYGLKSQIREYERLGERYAKARQEEEALAKLTDMIEGYLKTLGLDPQLDPGSQLRDMQRRLQSYHAAAAEFKRVQSQKIAFEQKEDMDAILDLDVESLEHMPSLEGISERLRQISQRLSGIESNLTAYDRQMDSLQEQMEKIMEDEKNLELLEEQAVQYRRNYDLLTKTREFLAQAKISFTARYTGPLMESFGKYYHKLARETADRYHMDANIKLTVDEKGQQREMRSFSTGYRDLVGICMRMALVDAMYREEKPFIIFDDPFVNLDKAKVEGGLEFLKEVSSEYQILYFTCHESRAI